MKLLCRFCSSIALPVRNTNGHRLQSQAASAVAALSTVRSRSLSSDSSRTTVDPGEVHRFSQLAHKWWDEGGEYGALHSMNRLRVPLVTQSVNTDTNELYPLTGLQILDVGCGGGLLSEPLARLGGKVVGLDATQENISAANERLKMIRDPQLEKNLSYLCLTVEDYVMTDAEKFDILVASEVVEHVNNLDRFIESCVKLTKPGGSLVFTTLNKTSASYWLAVIAAEYVAGLVPRGTHDWDKFVPPHRLQELLERNGCQQRLIHGMCLNPLTTKWSWIANTDINYAATFVKNRAS